MMALGVVHTLRKTTIIGACQRATGVYLYRWLPRGAVIGKDIRTFLPKLNITLVFDVGANIGQSAKKFSTWFRGSRIYCFEPVEASFAKLNRELCGVANTRTFHLALGSHVGSSTMGSPASNSYFMAETALDVRRNTENQQVEMQTLDFILRGRTNQSHWVLED